MRHFSHNFSCQWWCVVAVCSKVGKDTVQFVTPVPLQSFFIRCTRDSTPSFICLADSCCDVTHSNRLRCQACRYQKCLRIGMTRKGSYFRFVLPLARIFFIFSWTWKPTVFTYFGSVLCQLHLKPKHKRCCFCTSFLFLDSSLKFALYIINYFQRNLIVFYVALNKTRRSLSFLCTCCIIVAILEPSILLYPQWYTYIIPYIVPWTKTLYTWHFIWK